MAGLISQAQGPVDPSASVPPQAAPAQAPIDANAAIPTPDDPILAKIEKALEAKLKPEDLKAYKRIVIAGMKIMFDPKTHQLVAATIDKEDPINGAIQGVQSLMTTLFKQSRGSMPPVPAITASVTLLCNALGFMEKSGMITQLSNEQAAEAVKTLTDNLMAKAGLTSDKIESYSNQAKQVAKIHPQVVQQVQQQIGA